MIVANDLITELNQRLGPFAPLVNLFSAGAWAMREMGFPTASPLTVTSDDLLQIVDTDINELFDFIQYVASERIFENLDDVQLRGIGISEKAEDLRKVWRIRIDNLQKKLEKKYGYGLPTLSAGTIDLDFQSRKDDVDLWGGME